MARGFSKATAAIQRLLDERQQIQTWLKRLSVASDTTPEQVRERVRADYERRLAEVMTELQTHESDLHTTMDRLESTRAGLARQETEAAERLSEAELRHSVGEYDESQWRQVHADLQTALAKVREELKQSDDEIERLEEVMSLIEAPPVRGPGPTVEPVKPVEPLKRDSPPVAPPRRKEAAASAGQQDELAFLRSVTEDETQGPAPSRASGAMRAIQEPVPAAPASGKEYADPEAKKGAMPRSSKATKSLKCKECGTMNLPTEWYCERCGAELAAL